MSRRSERLADELREQVAELLRDEVKDPRIGFVTITRVELTGDLGFARVFVGVLGDEAQRHRSLEGLKQAAGFLRRQLARRLRIYQVPELRFQYDTGLDATDRVAQLLRETAAAPTSESAERPEAPVQAEPPDEGGEPS